MNCPYCGSEPRRDWGFECGSGPANRPERSIRCRDLEAYRLREEIRLLKARLDLCAEANRRLEKAGDAIVENGSVSESLFVEWTKAKASQADNMKSTPSA